ncbi:uncharacterized protein METZ01_LOCUS191531 [marine metagenome]|uniref:Uncharacterized protein n=1 Tax=marine metagenome TaxID=408172 RepID=A0A382DM29_9ZZZZ
MFNLAKKRTNQNDASTGEWVETYPSYNIRDHQDINSYPQVSCKKSPRSQIHGRC